MTVFITLVIVLLLLFWGLATYNRLVTLRKGVQKAWRQIGGPLKRRHELVPSYVEAVRGAVGIEHGTLESVITARNAAVTATGPVDAAAKEGALSQSLARLLALVDSDPQFTANVDVRSLQDRLAAAEAEIVSSRRTYNAIATSYNTATQVVPGNVIKGLGRFPRAELFALPDP